MDGKTWLLFGQLLELVCTLELLRALMLNEFCIESQRYEYLYRQKQCVKLVGENCSPCSQFIECSSVFVMHGLHKMA
ncbi:MAG: hypothetical protein EZS28_007495 [Streblomastix strix]|uniref:Secreted protein n=1 Tax=Streblomastix strix TaxID=222440 RepID=A0A5J4WQ32_9EUKA|nr:MAG: hypothetical protein EZS28_007495 [Streblomastix strix]